MDLISQGQTHAWVGPWWARVVWRGSPWFSEGAYCSCRSRCAPPPKWPRSAFRGPIRIPPGVLRFLFFTLRKVTGESLAGPCVNVLGPLSPGTTKWWLSAAELTVTIVDAGAPLAAG